MKKVPQYLMFPLIAVLTISYSACDGCNKSRNQNGSAQSGQPKSFYERNDGAARVIVFVHGIFGSSRDTWNCSPETSWPALLKDDPAFKDSDIYVAGYDTHYVGNRMSMDEVVSNLKSRLDSDGVFAKHREVVIVAHSLGGLIVQRLLLTYRDLAKNVRFIYFYSTPQTGAQIAQLGHLFSKDPLLKEMLPGDSNDYLLNLENEWQGARFTIHRYCAYEKQPLSGVLVVDRLSGTRGCETAVPMNENHSTIVKPCDRNSDSYIALRNAVKEIPILPEKSPTTAVTENRAKLVLLKFTVKSDREQPPSLSFLQRYPIVRDARQLNADQSDGHYQEYVDWPDKDERFEAAAVRSVLTSEVGDYPISKSATFCFMSNPRPPTNQPRFEVLMKCVEGDKCSFSPSDYGWADGCPKDKTGANSPLSFVPELRAQTTAENAVKTGWRVPSLETLRQMSASKSVGYTEFSLKATHLPGLENANSFRYQITANGSPLYVDGWAPNDMLKEFNASKGLDFSFGLENLSFSGADDGCEDIGVLLEFRKGNQTIKKVQLTRRYAALRGAVTEEIKTEDGLAFTWTGKYVKPQNEDRSEVFVISTTDLKEASRTKSQIAKANLTYQGMSVVGVLRPPLNEPQYGVVTGLLQPTGQIKFTLNPASAQQLLAWATSQRSTNKGPFRYAPFIYQMRLGDSGPGKLKSCSAAAYKE